MEALNIFELNIWQIEIIDRRMDDYRENLFDVENFDEMLNEIEKQYVVDNYECKCPTNKTF